jgi:hypothetical protein
VFIKKIGMLITIPHIKTFIITLVGSGNLSDLTKNQRINKEGKMVKASK